MPVILCASVALFLFGMTALSSGLQQLTAHRLEQALHAVSGSFGRSVLTGLLATAVLQSSSALTVLVIGLAAAGKLGRDACTGLIVGANLGTCMTAQLVRLGLEHSGPGLLSSPTALLASALGCALCLYPRRPPVLAVAAGLLALFTGMTWMEQSLAPVAAAPQVQSVLSACMGNPISGLCAGLLVTAVLQSSSAAVGLLQGLAHAQSLSVGAVFPVIVGQNIGTCVTGLLAAIGGGPAARQTAFIHLRFNVCGALCAMPVIAFFSVFSPPIWHMPADSGTIANLHLLFNVGTAVVFCGESTVRTRSGHPGSLRPEKELW